MVIMDQILSADIPKRSFEVIETLPDNSIFLLADTPAELKKEEETPAEEISEPASTSMPPTGPILAPALAASSG